MPQFAHHPARLAALAAGEKKWRGPDCPKHGETLRHTSSGQCITCNRERSAMQAIVKAARRERYVKLADRPERRAAVARGDVIYLGPPCLNGHGSKRRNQAPRYTSSNRCVACAQASAGGVSPAEPVTAVSAPHETASASRRPGGATRARQRAAGLVRGLIGKVLQAR